MSIAEQATHSPAQQEARYQAPEPVYGFVGRDVDILQIEKRVLSTSEGKQRNLLLVRGMGGRQDDLAASSGTVVADHGWSRRSSISATMKKPTPAIRLWIRWRGGC